MLKCPCGKGCKSPITEENFYKLSEQVQNAFVIFCSWCAEELFLRSALALHKEKMPEYIAEALETVKKSVWPDHEGQTLGDSDYIKHLEQYAML